VSTVRVATYNVRDLLDDNAAAARTVRAIAPDVLCLQEFPRWVTSLPRMRAFEQATGMSWVGRSWFSGGTTIFTADRASVAYRRHRHLWVRPFRSPRGYALAGVRVEGMPEVLVGSIHLGLFPAERVRHARQILRRVAGDRPVVLAGDLNELDDGAALTELRAAGGMRVVSPPTPTFTARNPRQRIDVVLASVHLVPVEGRPVHLDPAELVAASDHRPTWADLTLA
jgi:endonuclease/exonuclease/phosphatase family metal-dependent hydrolase